MTTRPTYLALPTPTTPTFSTDPSRPLSPGTSAAHNALTYTHSSPPTPSLRPGWRTLTALRTFAAQNTGLLLIVASQAFYSLMNVAVKTLNGLHPPVPPLELILVRMTITYVCCTSYMLLAGVNDPFLGPKGVRLLLVFRGFCGFFGLFGIYFALQYLTLSDATVITFLAPMFTALGGALFLGERVRRGEIVAGLCALCGVVLIARPTFLFGGRSAGTEDGPTSAQRLMAVLVSLVGVFGAAGAYLSIRAIGSRAHAMHSLTSFSGQSVLASLALSLPFSPLHALGFEAYVLPSSTFHILLLVAIGTLGFVAQALMTTGLQRETAGRGAVGMYAQIVFAGLYDAFLFHVQPSTLSLTGTAIIVASAMYVAVTKKGSGAKAQEPQGNSAKANLRTSEDTAMEEGLLDEEEAT